MSRLLLLAVATTCCLAPAPHAAHQQFWDEQGLSVNQPPAQERRPLKDRGVVDLLVQLYADSYEGEVPAEVLEPQARARREYTTSAPKIDDVVSVPSKNEPIAVVGKCCPIGQNLTSQKDEMGNVVKMCTPSDLIFQPYFYDSNETAIWFDDRIVWETIVSNPCQHGRYKLDPTVDSKDEFYLLTNGSIVAPYHDPKLLNINDFCMEVFWSSEPVASEGISLPLVCFPASAASTGGDAPSNIRLVIIAIVMLISVPFLCVTAAAYLMTQELRNNHGKSLAIHCICLAIAYLALACTQLAGPQSNSVGCFAAAVIIQFFFLTCFCWLTIVCFDTYQNIKKHLVSSLSPKEERCKFIYYNFFGWCIPILIMLITAGMELVPSVPLFIHKPNFGAEGCWFETNLSGLMYFYGPVTCLLLINLVLFVLTCISGGNFDQNNESASQRICMPSPNSTRDEFFPDSDEFERRKTKYKKLIKKNFMLSMAMGLSWVLEIISWILGGSDWSWIAFDLFNASQGIVIFYIYVWKNPSEIHRFLLIQFPWFGCIIPNIDNLSRTDV